MVKRSIYRGKPRLRWVEPRSITWARWRAVRGEHALWLVRGTATGVAISVPIILLVILFVPGVEAELMADLPRAAVFLPLMFGTVALPFLLGGVLDVLIGRAADIRADRLVIAGKTLPGQRLDWVGVRTDHPRGVWLAARTRATRLYAEMGSNVFLDPSIPLEELEQTITECTGRRPEIVASAPPEPVERGSCSPWRYPPMA